MVTRAFLVAIALAACGEPEPVDSCDCIPVEDSGAPDSEPPDEDGDGWTVAQGDCDDGDDAIHPSAYEVCNNQDDDCDGLVDDEDDDLEGAPSWYLDHDDDGYGAGEAALTACEPPSGHAETDDDCDDDDANVHPDSSWEDCENPRDWDCDGRVEYCDFYLAGADARYLGIEEYDSAGRSVAVIPDWDGDGFGEAVVGATGAGEGSEGAVFLLQAPFEGQHSLADAALMLTGEADNDDAGWAVIHAGDLDADGVADLAIGASGHDYGGQIYIFDGPIPDDARLVDADATIDSASQDDLLGRWMACAGDVNGDGFDDLLLGSPTYDVSYTWDGAAYLLHGPIRGAISTADATAWLTGGYWEKVGCSVDSAGDVNGDGLDDLLIGASAADDDLRDQGAAFVVHGPVEHDMSLGNADAILWGVAEEDEAGTSVAGVGDTNQDGYDDVLIGTEEASTGYLVLGPASREISLNDADAKITGSSGYQLGQTVAAAGDVDGDGHADMLLGAPGESGGGAFHLVYGPVSGRMDVYGSDQTIRAETSDCYLGYVRPAAGDLDGDGRPDLLLGSAYNSQAAERAGAAWIVTASSLLGEAP